MVILVGLVGCGNMGSFIARYIDASKDYKLISVFDINIKAAERVACSLKHKPRVSKTVGKLIRNVDLIIEAASPGFVREFAIDVLREGKSLVIMSSAALVDGEMLDKIKKTAEENNAFVYLPSGAICGIDGIKSACMDVVYEVTLTTTKPPHAFEGVEYLKERGIAVERIKKRTVLYSGPAVMAGHLFPKNINVSTILSLAGIGLEKTKVKIIADPNVIDNIHEISLKGRCGCISVKLVNKPSQKNPKTSHLACLSAVRVLEDITKNIRIGN
jgi:aspartate dehydrogenase